MITPPFVRTMAAYNAEMNRRLYKSAVRRARVIALCPLSARHNRPRTNGQQPHADHLDAGIVGPVVGPFHGS